MKRAAYEKPRGRNAWISSEEPLSVAWRTDAWRDQSSTRTTPQRRSIMYIGGILGTVLVIVLILYLIRRI